MSTKSLIASIIASALIFNQSVLANPAIAPRFISGSAVLVKGSNNIRSFKYTQNKKTFTGFAYCSHAVTEPLYTLDNDGNPDTIIPTSQSGIALFRAACK